MLIPYQMTTNSKYITQDFALSDTNGLGTWLELIIKERIFDTENTDRVHSAKSIPWRPKGSRSRWQFVKYRPLAFCRSLTTARIHHFTHFFRRLLLFLQLVLLLTQRNNCARKTLRNGRIFARCAKCQSSYNL